MSTLAPWAHAHLYHRATLLLLLFKQQCRWQNSIAIRLRATTSRYLQLRQICQVLFGNMCLFMQKPRATRPGQNEHRDEDMKTSKPVLGRQMTLYGLKGSLAMMYIPNGATMSSCPPLSDHSWPNGAFSEKPPVLGLRFTFETVILFRLQLDNTERSSRSERLCLR